jgi:hypothetical protein
MNLHLYEAYALAEFLWVKIMNLFPINGSTEKGSVTKFVFLQGYLLP